ncbi:MAG TPA: hypothetical protein VMZ33_07375 [Candidatus Limnocylindrales bacterium]|nr:hypothetical protein [Candidatus Limnocylindrales bacterium]
MEASTQIPQPPVVILADDLIWSSRLVAAARNAEARPAAARSAAELQVMLTGAPSGTPVIVDLTGRGYDGVEQVRATVALGHRVLAVGQHEDLPTRKAALAAGAVRVLSYNKLFTDGPSVVSAFLEGRL